MVHPAEVLAVVVVAVAATNNFFALISNLHQILIFLP